MSHYEFHSTRPPDGQPPPSPRHPSHAFNSDGSSRPVDGRGSVPIVHPEAQAAAPYAPVVPPNAHVHSRRQEQLEDARHRRIVRGARELTPRVRTAMLPPPVPPARNRTPSPQPLPFEPPGISAGQDQELSEQVRALTRHETLLFDDGVWHPAQEEWTPWRGPARPLSSSPEFSPPCTPNPRSVVQSPDPLPSMSQVLRTPLPNIERAPSPSFPAPTSASTPMPAPVPAPVATPMPAPSPQPVANARISSDNPASGSGIVSSHEESAAPTPRGRRSTAWSSSEYIQLTRAVYENCPYSQPNNEKGKTWQVVVNTLGNKRTSQVYQKKMGELMAWKTDENSDGGKVIQKIITESDAVVARGYLEWIMHERDEAKNLAEEEKARKARNQATERDVADRMRREAMRTRGHKRTSNDGDGDGDGASSEHQPKRPRPATTGSKKTGRDTQAEMLEHAKRDQALRAQYCRQVDRLITWSERGFEAQLQQNDLVRQLLAHMIRSEHGNVARTAQSTSHPSAASPSQASSSAAPRSSNVASPSWQLLSDEGEGEDMLAEEEFEEFDGEFDKD